MSTLSEAKLPSLKDKLLAEEEAKRKLAEAEEAKKVENKQPKKRKMK